MSSKVSPDDGTVGAAKMGKKKKAKKDDDDDKDKQKKDKPKKKDDDPFGKPDEYPKSVSQLLGPKNSAMYKTPLTKPRPGCAE